ncbi:NmrA/HSCARG family protein [Staphylococcus equorum]|uniref:NmrA/HSCARG family protein n=1 Tax=Staphylococcus equorum TaxID=246432 RepID=UPI003D8085CA
MANSILVIGASGKQGNAVVHQLLEDGWKVRAFTRDRENKRLTNINNSSLEIIEGDLSNEEDLKLAMKNQYGLYSVQPIIPNDVEQELYQGKLIIETAEKQNIQHTVYSTAGGVNRNRKGPHFETLAEIENLLGESSLNHTIIKPSFFMDNFLRIVNVENDYISIPAFIKPDIKFAMISSIDIAKVAANIFKEASKYNHQAIEIASDELTLNEVVSTFEKVTGKNTEIKGEFTNQTAEKSWLEQKGYLIDFKKVTAINPTKLNLESWIKENFS